MAAKDETVEADGLITAVYKVNLHCHQCARDIRIPLMKTQGVHKVDVDFENHQITIKGMIDAEKIHQRIEKMSKKKVEMISASSVEETEKRRVKEDIKEPILRKTLVKVHLHCEKCEHDLEKMLLKHKGVYGIKIDTKSETIAIDGTIEPDQLLAYLQKKVHKHAEIITPPLEPVKTEEKKEIVKVETKITKSSSKKIEEFEEEKKVEEIKEQDNNANVNNVPYFIHYVYAPQTFSDENPNACCVM